MAETLQTKLENGVFTVSLARPDVRNAFNDAMIMELKNIFEEITKDSKIRAVVLCGEGKVFCAGGDLEWMKNSIELSPQENLEETRKLAQMFYTLNSCPKPVIGLIHGAAIGGGVGLVSICDYVLCSKETVFSLSEVRLGIIPACIGPFVLAKIGESYARAFFMSSQRFTALQAFQMGLVHQVVESPEDLEKNFNPLLQNLRQCGPNALAAAKSLIQNLQQLAFPQSLDYAAKCLADIRTTPEGQEGVKAFLEKRKPAWIVEGACPAGERTGSAGDKLESKGDKLESKGNKI